MAYSAASQVIYESTFALLATQVVCALCKMNMLTSSGIYGIYPDMYKRTEHWPHGEV